MNIAIILDRRNMSIGSNVSSRFFRRSFRLSSAHQLRRWRGRHLPQQRGKVQRTSERTPTSTPKGVAHATPPLTSPAPRNRAQSDSGDLTGVRETGTNGEYSSRLAHRLLLQVRQGGSFLIKQRVRAVLGKANLVASPKPPFLIRRYRYKGQQKMHAALGELAAPTRWKAVDTPPTGQLADVFTRSPGADKWPHYLPIYESLLDRDRAIRMLEIGVFHGGSLRMWREYLHPDSVIVGIDIDPDCKQFDNPELRVHVRIGGQQDAEFLAGVVAEFGPFDVIVDDGSHMTSHMVESFRHLFATGLSERGIYVVEDVHTNFWLPYRDSPTSFVDFIGVLVDAMHAHYPQAESDLNFRTGHPAHLADVSVPRITPLLGSIEIHDSVVVVRKTLRDLPRSVYVR